jgi:hypothetical protein
MGLDITAMRQLTPAPDAELDSGGCLVDYEKFWQPGAAREWAEKEWPGRTEGIGDAPVYAFAESFGFRAGSYSGHGWFRDNLALLVGYLSAEARWTDEAAGPFLELIDFADNEGCIGSVVAAKLAADFAKWQERAEKFAPSLREGDYWLATYANWRKAFEMAADSGAVDFH